MTEEIKKKLTVAFSGHRKLGNSYDTTNITYRTCRELLKSILIEIKPAAAISGMALGVDQMCAETCLELGIALTAACPFEGQERVWPPPAQERWRQILTKAASIVTVSPGGYSPHKLQIRNQYLIDNCDLLISIYDQSDKGGTANCIKYATLKNREMININPLTFEINWSRTYQNLSSANLPEKSIPPTGSKLL